MEQSGTSALLQGAVQDLASGVVLALSGGDHVIVSGADADDIPSAGLVLPAVRVLGADLLLPQVLFRTLPDMTELAVFRKAVESFPPRADAAPAVRWSHWAMRRTLRRFEAAPDGVMPGDQAQEPDVSWLFNAVPGEDCAVTQAARRRPVDLARGFVRAVRRRDWQQAAGAGRWLTLLDGVPPELGLETGLDFVELMGGTDARVTLQVRAARVMRAAGARV
jgi:hypothetical protein